MEQYSFLADARQEEIEYYQKLIEIATQNSTMKIEGLYAVQFFQKSGLQIDVLSIIWELSSVMKQSYLSPPEFIIYCKYIAMHQ